MTVYHIDVFVSKHNSTMFSGSIRPLLPVGKAECLTPWRYKYDGPRAIWPQERLTVKHPKDQHTYEVQLSHMAFDLLYPWPTDIRTGHHLYGPRKVRKLNNNSYIINFELPPYAEDVLSSVFHLIQTLASEKKCRGDWNNAAKHIRQCNSNIFDVVTAACILHLEDSLIHLFLHLFPAYARLNKSVLSDYRSNCFTAKLALACANHPLFPHQAASEMMKRIHDFMGISTSAWDNMRHSNTLIAEQMTETAQIWRTTVNMLPRLRYTGVCLFD